jgi:hypothetical protein
MDAWQPLGAVAPTALVDARLQLHWAAQAILAAADRLLRHADDDSHTNMRWLADTGAVGGANAGGALVGNELAPGRRVALRIAALELAVVDPDGAAGSDDRFALAGRTLAAALAWLTGRLEAGAPLALRDYDMPAHAVAGGAPFAAPGPAHAELARWLGDGFALLDEVVAAQAAPDPVASACWPHHFDVGNILRLDRDLPAREARQIGIGVSPGDASYPEPYLYLTPWPIPDGAALPPLATGRWHTAGFTGAVLTGTELAGAGDAAAQHALGRRFFDDNVTVALELIGPREDLPA